MQPSSLSIVLSWRRPRTKLVICALLDAVGVWIAHSFLTLHNSFIDIRVDSSWLAYFCILYLASSWLFGSYSILKWTSIRLRVLAERIILAIGFAVLLVVATKWLLGFNAIHPLLLRGNLVALGSLLFAWSFALRLIVRSVGAVSGNTFSLIGVISPTDLRKLRAEWKRTLHLHDSSKGRPFLSTTDSFRSYLSSLPLDRLVLSAECTSQDVTAKIAEDRLERMPPQLIHHDFSYHDIPWSNELLVQRKIKRLADAGLSLVLLLMLSPLLLLLIALIYLEDGGPVFFLQERSGWNGSPFKLYKFRTMTVASRSTITSTSRHDNRITWIGGFMRPLRLDELPQLLNVIKGEMSLIGPRPEIPELELRFEERLPHYRKRHWMPPGLSGWAQVNAPYASSLAATELKLSYDLYYLRHWNTGLDFLIFFKTIKTILKLWGR